MLLRTFGWSFAVTALGLVAGRCSTGGGRRSAIVAILSVLEISLSFDNAVVNAGILKKMNAFWQKIFLTVGMLIAVFGMRLVFPVIIVAITREARARSRRSTSRSTTRTSYEHLVTDAHPAIAAFGGMFLLMIFLDFIFEEREHQVAAPGWSGRWPSSASSTCSRSCIALVVLLVTAITFATHAHQHGGARRQGADGPALRHRSA